MIVVAIIGILAAIAIPSMIEMQLKAKRAELPTNCAGIKTAEDAYNAAFDDYIELGITPRVDDDLDKLPVPWATTADWTSIGWVPDGNVRGNYQVGLSPADHPESSYLVTARADVDGDDALSEYTATEGATAIITESRMLYY